ncbi:MAG: beta-ketoacyl-ACP synthase III [Phycisphaeraceae bacterium]
MSRQPACNAMGVRLAGTGISVPQRVLTNDDLAKMVQTSDDWITQRTGIKERRIADEGTTVRDLARDALVQAIQNAGIEPRQIDLLLCATLTPEMCCPSTAARLVAELGATPAGAMDLSAACSGFVYALNIAAGMIQARTHQTVAIVGVETLSRITDYNDRRMCILFGDGAGAAIVTASDDPGQGCVYQSMHSDGSLWHELYCPRTEADLPEDHDSFSGTFNTLQMNGREVYKFAVTTLRRMIDEALQAAGVTLQDLAMIIPHQSNKRILESARDRLGLPPDKMIINIDRYGNTSAASVPLCLHEQIELGRLKTGDLVLFVAIGGGMTWATSLWRL